jgi:hypothetical protein
MVFNSTQQPEDEKISCGRKPLLQEIFIVTCSKDQVISSTIGVDEDQRFPRHLCSLMHGSTFPVRLLREPLLAWRKLAVKNLIVLDETLPHSVTQAMACTFQLPEGKLEQLALLRFNHEQQGRYAIYCKNFID